MSIQFAAVADNFGRLLAIAYRRGFASSMTKDETDKYATTAVLRVLMREMLEPKIGKLRYEVEIYERLLCATIRASFGSNCKFFLLLSFDLSSDCISIIENKVIPLVQRTTFLQS